MDLVRGIKDHKYKLFFSNDAQVYNSFSFKHSFPQHVYVAQIGLTRRLAVDLLDKMNNPDNHEHYSEVDDDDLEVMTYFVPSKNWIC